MGRDVERVLRETDVGSGHGGVPRGAIGLGTRDGFATQSGADGLDDGIRGGGRRGL